MVDPSPPNANDGQRSVFSFATRNLFNLLINACRGTQAPWPNDDAAVSIEGVASLNAGGPHVLARHPAVSLAIQVVPQAHDFVHVAAQSRMLPAFTPESTSGGWVALSYAFDPPPGIPDIIIPQAQWNSFAGETELTGLTSLPGPVGALASFPGTPAPGFAYPAIIGSMDNVTATGAM